MKNGRTRSLSGFTLSSGRELVRPVAVVMNMFYTGLGIARSLGEQGIPVIGLSAHRIYGNHTRYAKVRSCPDSREDPNALLSFLNLLAGEIGSRSIIFPTRDDDVVFLDRFREELSPHFISVIPSPGAVHSCLDKWETYLSAQKADIPAPRSWKLEQAEDLSCLLPDIRFPCVLKPLSSHYWRRGGNWERVGGRKAICVYSASELLHEYERVTRADNRMLLQEIIPGDDDRLLIAACYMDRDSNVLASFTARKLLQVPEGFGTGCIVQTVDEPNVVTLAVRLLREMRFNGIAEVEFKWDSSCAQYKLIEVNPRPWDQHRLGHSCCVDLVHWAYCDLAGIALPQAQRKLTGCKWIAEDVFLLACLRSLWKRDGKVREMSHLGRGKRIYGIWCARDPFPFIAYAAGCFVSLLGIAFRRFPRVLCRRLLSKRILEQKTV